LTREIEFREHEKIVEAKRTIDIVNSEIRKGNHFYIEGYTTLADAGVLRVKLVTPDSNKFAHFQWAISSSGICETTFHEGASGGMAGGSGVTPLNNDRNSATTSDLTITSDIAVATTPGTLISNAKWGSAGFKQQIGGGTSRDDELILKKNTTYVRTFTSGAADNIIQFKASWYEYENC
jgi:hypothetical protein